MIVKITKEAKEWLRVAQMPVARQMIAELKKDETTAADVAKQAASIIFGYSNGVKVFEASAEIAGNERISNYYSDNSGILDVWITFSILEESKAFIIGGAYLSDIWQQGIIRDDVLRNRMFLRVYSSIK